MIEIRPAKRGDGKIILKMTRALAKHHGHASWVKAKAADYEKHLFVRNPLIGALVAHHDGKPAGAIVWHRSFSTNSAREIIYLEDLTVLPAFRRKGIAKALLKELAKLAVASGYPAIWWIAADWNEGALKFYKKSRAQMFKGFTICQVKNNALKMLERRK